MPTYLIEVQKNYRKLQNKISKHNATSKIIRTLEAKD